MPPLVQRLVDLLAIGRVSNLPTVWSNVLLGVFLACAIPTHYVTPLTSSSPRVHDRWSPDLTPTVLVLLLVASTAAYLCGTFLNDWKDAAYDRSHRPERAIPSGRVRRGSILALAILFGTASLLALLPVSGASLATGAALLASVAVYTWIHKQTPLAIIPMGLCRALLYLMGFFAVAHSINWARVWEDVRSPATVLADTTPGGAVAAVITMALGIAIYIAGLTLAARYESRPGGLPVARPLIHALLFAPLLTHTWWWLFHRPPFLEGWHLAIPSLVGLIPFLAWTGRAVVTLKRSIPSFVSRTLAGLCLVDLLAMPGIAATIHTGWPAIDSQPLLLALIPIGLFPLALALQRVAPAT